MRVPVGHRLLDAGLEVAARDVNRPRDGALVPLAALPHVDEDGRVGLPKLGRPRGVDLLDLALDLLEQLAIARHCFRKYSDLRDGLKQGLAAPFARVLARPRTSSRGRRRRRLGRARRRCHRPPGRATSRPSSPRRPEAERRPPPLELGLLVRDDPEARALRDAEELLESGEREQARATSRSCWPRIPTRSRPRSERRSPRGPTGRSSASRRWSPRNPRAASPASTSALRSWPAGDGEGAAREWREVERREPDSPAAVRADDILHPEFAPGRPPFVAPLEAPPGLEGLTPTGAARRARAARGRRRGRGEARVRHRAPARRPAAFGQRGVRRCGRRRPGRSPSPRVAAAVGRFDKDDPSQTFSRLGPLASGRRRRRRPLPPRARALLDRPGGRGEAPARALPSTRPRTGSTGGKHSGCSTV